MFAFNISFSYHHLSYFDIFGLILNVDTLSFALSNLLSIGGWYSITCIYINFALTKVRFFYLQLLWKIQQLSLAPTLSFQIKSFPKLFNYSKHINEALPHDYHSVSISISKKFYDLFPVTYRD